MQWVLITGATSGIGRECALSLAHAGYGVIATGRNPDALHAIESEATRDRLKLVPLSLDVTDATEIQNAARVSEILTEGRGVHALINNAGYGQTGFLLEISSVELRRQFEVNLFSVLELTRAMLPQLERNHGVVINMGSIISRITAPWVGLYAVVKNALRMLTDVMRVELQSAGIRVVLVEPGAIKTPFFERAIAGQAGLTPAGSEQATDTPSDSEASSAGLSLQGVYARARRLLRQANYRPFFFLPPIGPQRVARLLVKIVGRSTLRRRYVIPAGAGFLLGLVRLVPRAILDRLKRRAFYLA